MTWVTFTFGWFERPQCRPGPCLATPRRRDHHVGMPQNPSSAAPAVVRLSRYTKTDQDKILGGRDDPRQEGRRRADRPLAPIRPGGGYAGRSHRTGRPLPTPRTSLSRRRVRGRMRRESRRRGPPRRSQPQSTHRGWQHVEEDGFRLPCSPWWNLRSEAGIRSGRAPITLGPRRPEASQGSSGRLLGRPGGRGRPSPGTGAAALPSVRSASTAPRLPSVKRSADRW